MNNSSNITIILTSTINVKLNIVPLYQKDANQRLSVYLKSVKQWLEKTKFNIILVENSGYKFDELDKERSVYSERFEIITFDEKKLDEAKYLEGKRSKGASEIFSISYAFNNSKIIKPNHFIIKITGRYFIPELESYLNEYDLSQYYCITQNNRKRCEMVGCQFEFFSTIFNIHLYNNKGKYEPHIESIWHERTLQLGKVLVCKEFDIETTQRGGPMNKFYDKL